MCLDAVLVAGNFIVWPGIPRCCRIKSGSASCRGRVHGWRVQPQRHKDSSSITCQSASCMSMVDIAGWGVLLYAWQPHYIGCRAEVPLLHPSPNCANIL